jgi:hypothetical protein
VLLKAASDARPGGLRRRHTEALGAVLVITACFVIFQTQVTGFFGGVLGEIGGRQQALLTVLVGAVLGVMVTLTSVGAGAIGVTALIVLYPKLSPARIVGSDVAHAVPLTLLAGIGHWWLGDVNLSLVGVWDSFARWVPQQIGERRDILVAMDWTDFDHDGQSTLALSLVTGHGRAATDMADSHAAGLPGDHLGRSRLW